MRKGKAISNGLIERIKNTQSLQMIGGKNDHN